MPGCSGSDTLFAGNADGRLLGGSCADWINGGADVMNGGNGTDVFIVDAADTSANWKRCWVVDC